MSLGGTCFVSQIEKVTKETSTSMGLPPSLLSRRGPPNSLGSLPSCRMASLPPTPWPKEHLHPGSCEKGPFRGSTPVSQNENLCGCHRLCILVGAPGDSWAYWNLKGHDPRVTFLLSCLSSFHKYILGFTLLSPVLGTRMGRKWGGEERPEPLLLLLLTTGAGVAFALGPGVPWA